MLEKKTYVDKNFRDIIFSRRFYTRGLWCDVDEGGHKIIYEYRVRLK